MTGFAPYATEIMGAYGISSFSIAFTLIIFQIVYVPLNFPATYLFDHYGILPPTVIGAICYIVGAWI
jgi:fucose permease